MILLWRSFLTRGFRALAIFVAAVTRAALAADDDCTALLKHGLYNYASTVSSNVQAATFQSNLCQTYSRYTSDKLSGSTQASYGVISGGLSLSKEQVDAIGQMLCTSSYSNSSAAAALTTTSSVIDGAAVAAFQACATLNKMLDGLHVITQESSLDPKVVNLAVRYISPPGPEKQATLQYVAYDRSAVSCKGDLVDNTSKTIDSSVRGITCTRTLFDKPTKYNVGTGTTLVYATPTTITISTNAGQYAETLAAIAAAPAPPPSASIPLGGVVAWYRFRTSDPLPDGYWIADGSTINDPNSPYNGITAPNLVDHFVMGVTLVRMGEAGGNNAIPAWPGGTFGVSGTTFSAQATGSNSDAYKHNADRGCCPQVTGLDHTHSFGGTTTISSHDHGGDKRPAYVGFLYLIRIR